MHPRNSPIKTNQKVPIRIHFQDPYRNYSVLEVLNFLNVLYDYFQLGEQIFRIFFYKGFSNNTIHLSNPIFFTRAIENFFVLSFALLIFQACSFRLFAPSTTFYSRLPRDDSAAGTPPASPCRCSLARLIHSTSVTSRTPVSTPQLSIITSLSSQLLPGTND